MNAIAANAVRAALHNQLPSVWEQTLSQAIGPDARLRNAQELQAAAHWQARPTLVLLVAESNDLTYEHVPLTPRRSIKARYRNVGRIPAREFPTDD